MENHDQPYDDCSQQHEVNDASFDPIEGNHAFFQEVDYWSGLGSFDLSAQPDFPKWLEEEMARDVAFDNVQFAEPPITFDAPNQNLHQENFAPEEVHFAIDDPAWWDSDNASTTTCQDGEGPPALDAHLANEILPQQFACSWTYTNTAIECPEAHQLSIMNDWCLAQGQQILPEHEATMTNADALPSYHQDSQPGQCFSPSTVGDKSMDFPSEASPCGRKRKASFDLSEVPQAISRSKKPKIYHRNEGPESEALIKHINAGVVPAPCPVTFESPSDFKANLTCLKEMYRKRTQECSFPCGRVHDVLDVDKTFPQSEEDYIRYVGLVKNAILDWTRYIEWMQCVPREAKQKRSAELVAKIEAHEDLKKDPNSDIQPTSNALEIPDLISPNEIVLPCLEKQHKHLLGRGCNALTAECLSWQLVQAAMESQQGRAGCVHWTTNDGA
ncbi:uncharacterized protein J7T54_004178 [Emericellopsis cladophorae]|uniref:Uncharacterized protein n=1 Tax=Emericellopsis cladophorae TaxID=2686198 RepID=A0A9P9XUX5_9HYPO|nr:uncharacterized protein J7T54_004178 [Emericellopsis cladophorae]KAI6778271.1 hypothetical protein J7T54_004178 [Emericellopsis cladophorae]